jgi:hypothetical protein
MGRNGLRWGGKGERSPGRSTHTTPPTLSRRGWSRKKGSADAKGREQKASTDPVDSGSRESGEEEDGDVGVEVESRNPIRCGAGLREVRPGQCRRVQASVIPVRRSSSGRACGLGLWYGFGYGRHCRNGWFMAQ